MRFFVVFFLLASGIGSAWASGAGYHRQPVFSTIPCQGRLDESRAESGNVYHAFNSMTLACVDRDNHAKWILVASAGCDVDNDDENGKIDDACGKKMSEPVGRFIDIPQKDPQLHSYALGRYVFALDCLGVRFQSRSLEIVTNKILTTSPGLGWACRQVNKVDGLSAADTNFRYARISTRGPEEKMDENGNEGVEYSDVLGTTTRDIHYQVHATHGFATSN